MKLAICESISFSHIIYWFKCPHSPFGAYDVRCPVPTLINFIYCYVSCCDNQSKKNTFTFFDALLNDIWAQSPGKGIFGKQGIVPNIDAIHVSNCMQNIRKKYWTVQERSVTDKSWTKHDPPKNIWKYHFLTIHDDYLHTKFQKKNNGKILRKYIKRQIF